MPNKRLDLTKLHTGWWFAFFMLANLVLFYFVLGADRFWHLGDYQMVGSGDGQKNYYTFAYAIKHFNGWWFDGMIYPYGDYILYGDSQPLIVWGVKVLQFIGIDLTLHPLLILNLLPILGFGIGTYYIFLLLRHFKMPHWYAALFALFCIFLSPQMFRFTGHYALSYAFVIPVYWWFWIRYRSSFSIGNLAFLLIFPLAIGFVHPYLLLSLALLGTSIWTVFSVTNRKLYWKQFIIVGIPLMVFLLITSVTDPITDRPENPWGAEAFKTEWAELIPFTGYLKDFFGTFTSVNNEYREGYCYLGILSFILLIYYIRSLVYRKFARDRISHVFNFGELKSYFFAGLLVLAFSAGIHIILTDGKILEWVPKLQQFRGLGRFSWGFYYVGFIFLAVVFYQLWTQIKSKWLRWELMALVLAFYAYDSYCFQNKLSESIDWYGSGNMLEEQRTIDNMVKNAGMDDTDFQGILTLPMSTEGMEKLSFHDSWHVRATGFPYSYQTGLAMTACVFSRASTGNVMKTLQLGNSKYGQKSVLKDMNEKNMLAIVHPDDEHKYKDLLKRGTLLGKEEKVIHVYSLPIDAFRPEPVQDSSLNSAIRLDTISSIENGYFSNFESSDNDIGLESRSSFYCDGLCPIFETDLNLDTITYFDFSVWLYISPEKSNVPAFNLLTYDAQGNSRYKRQFRDWDIERVEVRDNWARFKLQFGFGPEDKKISIDLQGEHIYIDWLLFHPVGDVYFSEIGKENLVYYDHLIATKSAQD